MSSRLALLLSLSLLPLFMTPAFGLEPEAGVSRDLARQRARDISNVRYQISASLQPKAERMPGDLTLEFDLAQIPDPLVLDFRDGLTRDLKINGSAQTIVQANGHLLLPAGALRKGANRVELHFESGIAEANKAITRYNDSQDGSEYLYSLFVPMDASLAFPCFDQPDLKARFTFTASAPAGWTVISNTTPKITGQTFAFEPTQPLSTYLFAFAAGPFERLESEKLHLYVRKSKLARAREEWPAVSDTTRKGIALMASFFNQPFPFPKYDQVLIPGFPYGGMEHAGATFLNEDTVLFPTTPTVNDLNRRNTTVLHELAHQWFGDFVTMRWFDDLWLKEGFAQYMSFHTQAELEPAAAVWKRFYQSIKPLAYAIDGTHGTTPIYQQIPNLKDAKSAYGAIVYQKAPSLLRLLAFKIGEDHFRDGVRIFLKEHAYANAEWSDLIGAFSRASASDLKPWANSWVQQRGMPEIEIEWTCSGASPRDRVLKSVEIHQKDALGEGRLWPLQTEILLGYEGGRYDRIPATLDKARATVPAATGKSCPAWIFANNEDHAYGRFLLDPRSQAAILEQLPTITDPFMRTLLWGALWDGMRELRLAPLEYLNLGLRTLPSESDPELAVSLVGRMREAFTLWLSSSQRAQLAERFEDLLLRQLAAAPTPDLRITYYRGLVAVATTARGRGALKDLLASRLTIPGVSLKQRDRWNMIASLVGSGDPSGPELLAAETTRDPSGDGRKYSFVAAAGAPESAAKQQYFASYIAPSGPQEDWITASLSAFNHWNQTELTARYLKPALDALPAIKRERKIFFLNNWLASFIGDQISPDALATVDAFLKNQTSDPDLRLKILEVRDELARTVRIRQRFAQ